MQEKIITRISNFLSFVFSPLLVPTYGVAIALWCSVLTFIPLVYKWRIIGLVFGLTSFLPALLVAFLKWRGKVSDFGLNVRKERPIPYCFVCLCYLGCAWCFHVAHFPMWIQMFMCGAAAATFISLIVNNWWKISAHMAAMGGLIGLVMRLAADNDAVSNPLTMMMWVVAAAGVVGAARVWLNRHTVGQVIAGAVNGAVCVYLFSGI